VERGQQSPTQISDIAGRNFKKWLNDQKIVLSMGIAACYVFGDLEEAKSDRQELIDDSKKNGEDVVETFFPSLGPLKKHKKNYHNEVSGSTRRKSIGLDGQTNVASSFVSRRVRLSVL
jgi:hypothetical protein